MYQIGQIVPLDASRGILGGDIPATWYALLTAPQKERAACETLKAKGIHTAYPVRESSHRTRGKMIVRKLPVVSRIVYAKFERAPQWDVLKHRRIIQGVFSYGDQPIEIHRDVIRAVMGLPTVAEELEAARREMLRVREGERARVVSGPFAGHLVDVRRVSHGRVWWETLTGIKGEASETALERDTNACNGN